MAASATAAQSLTASAPATAIRDTSSLSCSSSPFVAYTVHAAPLKFHQATTKARLVAAKCSLSEEQLSGKAAADRRQVLAGLMAATAALAVSSDLALAASGPGINIGAQGTAEKANDLLKGAADKLNIQDAPKRFGPGIPGAAKDATKVAQKAGSGAIGDLQAGATDVTRQARQNVEDTARRTGGLFGNAKDNAGGVAGNVQDGAKNILGQVQGKKDDARSAAKDVVGQAQSKANDGKGVLGSIQEGIQGFTESVAQKGSDAKTAAEGAASNAQKALQ